ncbi:MAG: hypothetical protein K6F99_03885 [Lachnospiraceae bacterium]|nr:hypothetical protein [Lachnospiraceae bacterium]
MEKALNRYLLFLKAAMKKKTTYLMIAVLTVLSVMLVSLEKPDKNNVRVLLCGNDEMSDIIIDDLVRSSPVFKFERAADKDTVYNEVKENKADCGFVFCEDFGKKLQNGEDTGVIENVMTPYSVKDVVAREQVYAAVLRHYSDELLDNGTGNILTDGRLSPGNENENTKGVNAEADGIFDVDYEYVKTDKKYKEINGKGFMKKGKALPVHGVLSLMVVLMILFSDMESKFKKESFFRINKKMRRLHNLAYVTPVALAGFVMIRIFENVTPIWVDIIAIILLVRLAMTFSMIFSFPFKREESMISAILLFVIISLTITPVLYNVGDILPAAMYISAIMPNGAYLVCMELVLS